MTNTAALKFSSNPTLRLLAFRYDRHLSFMDIVQAPYRLQLYDERLVHNQVQFVNSDIYSLKGDAYQFLGLVGNSPVSKGNAQRILVQGLDKTRSQCAMDRDSRANSQT